MDALYGGNQTYLLTAEAHPISGEYPTRITLRVDCVCGIWVVGTSIRYALKKLEQYVPSSETTYIDMHIFTFHLINFIQNFVQPVFFLYTNRLTDSRRCSYQPVAVSSLDRTSNQGPRFNLGISYTGGSYRRPYYNRSSLCSWRLWWTHWGSSWPCSCWLAKTWHRPARTHRPLHTSKARRNLPAKQVHPGQTWRSRLPELFLARVRRYQHMCRFRKAC